MTFQIKSAVVIDDALGPPARGTVNPQDKDDWIEFVSGNTDAEKALRDTFHDGAGPDLDTILSTLTGQGSNLDSLWGHYQKGAVKPVQLEILFRGAALYQVSRSEKARMVVEKLAEMIGSENVHSFSSIDSASTALATADVAFVDFYLSNDETEAAAIERITNASAVLKQAKLLFFMSSRASLDVQQSVRQKVGVRTAFFEVMKKGDITPEYLSAKLLAKQTSFANNQSLEGIVRALVDATKDALTEFEAECEELEVHDLRMLDLARLDSEGESLAEYLTWLFSESVAAKTRKKALPIALQNQIATETIGFTGQIRQGKVLFEQFSEIVFGPPISPGKPIRFGEMLRLKSDPTAYLLVLTPACDLQRCEPTKTVLCVRGIGETYVGSKAFARERLYGKQDDGRLCHLFTPDVTAGAEASSTMINWARDQIVTFTVQELNQGDFDRLSLMNELFAQEVKEDVLRVVGRIGTQIDPPPVMALHAKVRWKKADNSYREADAPRDSFVSALLSYSEQKDGGDRKKYPTVVLSDEFRLWVQTQIRGGLADGEVLHVKTQNCLDAALSGKQFQLPKGFSVKLNDLLIRVDDSNDDLSADTKAFLEIALKA